MVFLKMAGKTLVVVDYYDEKLQLKLEKLASSGVDLQVLPLGISGLNFKGSYSSLTFTTQEYDSYKKEALDYFITLPWLVFKREPLFHKYQEKYWFFSHTEKNIWFSKVPHFLFYLKMFQAAKPRFDKIEFLIKDSELRDLLTQSHHTSFFCDAFSFVKAVLTEKTKFLWKFLLFNFYFRKNGKILSQDNSKLLISIYPEWFKVDGLGRCSDSFFLDIIQPDEKSGWCVGLITYHWRQLFSALRRDKNQLNKKDIFFIDQYNTITDFFAIFNPINLWALFADFRRICLWENCFSFSGTDITPLISMTVKDSFTNGSFFSNLLLNKAFTRLNWKKIDVCLYRLEFQPFENTFLKISNGTKYWGFQHSVFGPNFANYIFPENVFLSESSPKRPDLILATGQSVKNAMINAGVEAKDVSLVGAVRFNRLFSYKADDLKEKFRQQLNVNKNQFLIFMPISPILNENQVLLRELKKSFMRFNFEIKLLIKINPNRKHHAFFIEAIQKELALMPAKVSIDLLVEDYRYYEFMKAADVVLMSGGTAGLEAILLNTHSIIFDAKNFLSHNPLAEYSKVFGVAYDQDDLHKYITSIRNHSFIVDENQKQEMLETFFDNKLQNAKDIFRNILAK